MQLLRTDYHTKETEYEGLEVALDQLEEEKNRIEIRFFRTLTTADITTDHTRGHHSQAKAEAQDSVGMRHTLMGILPDRPSVELHPLWADLSDAIGEINVAQEEVDDIHLAQQELTYELGLKERTKRTVSAKELELLDNFRADEQVKLARLKEATTQVNELYKRCMTEAAPYEALPYHIAFALGLRTDEEIVLDDSTSDTEETLFHRRYPRLLSQPHHLLQPEPLTVSSNLRRAAKLPLNHVDRGDQMRAALKEYGISHLLRDTKEMNKTDFINRWLLQYLRISPLQVEILAGVFTKSTHLQIVDTQRWELDVLLQWWKDGAAIRSVEAISHFALTSSITTSSPISSHDAKDRFRLRGSARSSQIRGTASEPPDNISVKHDIWESRWRLSGRLGSEATSDVLHLQYWSNVSGNNASTIMSDLGASLGTAKSFGG
ncbi:hypothetical protein BN1708_013427 [Verticillium longisporum]|uniref:Uncharacterized protein n=1 Tax=Verticillium longisporum TaxID=100787 RepID=A0A0G4LLC0_VERLO|nr:hypothetical protein BN1708_013427 [Verticillium longisporum]